MPTAYYKVFAKTEDELRAVDKFLVAFKAIRISKRRIKPKRSRHTLLIPGAHVCGPHGRN